MAKKKSKNKAEKLTKLKDKGTEVLGAKAKQVGTALAGIVIGGVAEAVIERLTHKDSNSSNIENGRGNYQTAAEDQLNTHSDENPAIVPETANARTSPIVNDTVETVKTLVSDFAPTLPTVIPAVVDSLKEAAQRSVQQSATTVSENSSAAVAEAVDTAEAVTEAVKPDKKAAKSDKKAKKDKKNKKKSQKS